MKAHWPGLVHKSQQHAVHLDLHGDAQVRAVYRDLETHFGGLMTGVVLQPLAARGTELFAGVVQDQVCRPLVLFGLGGIRPRRYWPTTRLGSPRSPTTTCTI